ncbi:RNA-binding domain-containing protein [Halegenticoccus tardaugens]|uniref:RNA-binding domain-containing protein n=1 Tax=Halegenticoccus tardaugens TaxID=2071624 RepID=UPI00100A2DA5|nr:RNA-binding domain-containing protein [Halegenticoccus tardaugens]
MIYSVDVRIVAPVRDTEVTDRVADAVRNLFPNAEVAHESGRIVAEAHSLDHFSDLLHEQAILDTARREFGKRRTEDGFSFALKKQAAFRGVVNFAVGNPDELGDVEVHVAVREPTVEEFVDHIAPPTEDGRPVDPDRRRE